MSEVNLLPLPEPDHVGGNDVFGKEFPLFTAEQAEAYARANMEPLIAENERLVEALRAVVADMREWGEPAKGAHVERIQRRLDDALRDHDQEGGK